MAERGDRSRRRFPAGPWQWEWRRRRRSRRRRVTGCMLWLLTLLIVLLVLSILFGGWRRGSKVGEGQVRPARAAVVVVAAGRR